MTWESRKEIIEKGWPSGQPFSIKSTSSLLHHHALHHQRFAGLERERLHARREAAHVELGGAAGGG
jgi:hypothetical protein